MGKFNHARSIDTRLTDPLAALPPGSFGPPDAQVPPIQANLAFRNLARGNMVKLASGQQMAARAGVTALTEDEIVAGDGVSTSPDWLRACATSSRARPRCGHTSCGKPS
jgi:hypothetical protein